MATFQDVRYPCLFPLHTINRRWVFTPGHRGKRGSADKVQRARQGLKERGKGSESAAGAQGAREGPGRARLGLRERGRGLGESGRGSKYFFQGGSGFSVLRVLGWFRV